MENAVLITVSQLTAIIQNSIRTEIAPILDVLGTKMITMKAAAGILGVSVRTLDRWRSECPELKYYVIGKSIKYSLSEIVQFKFQQSKSQQ